MMSHFSKFSFIPVGEFVTKVLGHMASNYSLLLEIFSNSFGSDVPYVVTSGLDSHPTVLDVLFSFL
jgi:hypothetical protein